MPYKDLDTRRNKAREYTAHWRAKNREKVWVSHKTHELRKKFGLTLQEWFEMMERQSSRCAICGTHNDDHWQSLHVDHCHTTGQVRGLLCQKCNRALGFFKDDPFLLRKAADYLENFVINP